MKALVNLTSQSTFECVPWDFVWRDDLKVKQLRREHKKIRTAWITRADTIHQCWSPWEGVNEAARVSAGSKADEGNPATMLHALVADFDSVVTEAEIVQAIEARCPAWFTPAFIEMTMTPGHCRFVWLLDKPLLFASHAFAVHCLKYFAEKTNLPGVLSGFDAGAFAEPGRYYTNSGEWKAIEGKPLVRSAILRGWVQEASEKFNWKPLGVSVPLDQVATALAAAYPRFGEWPGEFVLGSQGPSFWVTGSVSPTSAIVRETGLQTFAAHAHKAFFSWSELLGAAFVEEYRAKQIGAATEGIYFDGKTYWHTNPSENWNSYGVEDIARYLRIMREVSSARDKAGKSPLDRALVFIQEYQRVDEACPRVFQTGGLLREGTRRVLNVSRLRVLAPCDGPADWGAQGEFAWVSYLIDTLFVSELQRETFIAWLARYYQSGYHLRACSGQALFLAGGANIGKTLLNRAIIGKLMGGFADAGKFLAGRDNFGAELFEVGHWVVDDFSMFDDYASKKAFSENIKAAVANGSFRYHVKNQMPKLVPWTGRIVVTCNSDALSLDVLPDVDPSIQDKLIILRCVEKPTVDFPPREETVAILDKELPAFARYLLDHEIPAHLLGSSRFGVLECKDELLRITAEDASPAGIFKEILHSALQNYFRQYDTATYWQGSATQLLRCIDLDEGTKAMQLNAKRVGQMLHILMRRADAGLKITSCRKTSGSHYAIIKPAAEIEREENCA